MVQNIAKDGACASADLYEVSSLLKALGHQGRLHVFCQLGSGEKTVGELQRLTASRQAVVSGHLARLRQDKLVGFRKQGKESIYFLRDTRAQILLKTMRESM